MTGKAHGVDVLTAPIPHLFPKLSLSNISSVQQLAWLLGVDYGKVLSFALYRLPPQRAYKTFTIPKRDGTDRLITTPGPTMKKLQGALLPLLEEIYNAPPCVHGHVKGRSIKTNAAHHVGRRYLVNIDLEDFYPNIHFKGISRILQSSRYGLHKDVANAVAQICCYEGRLPIGAPTSGLISNIVSGPLDSAMMRLAKKNRLRYTRYVDDITFSSSSAGHLVSALGLDLRDSIILNGISNLSEEFVASISSCGFSINSKKVWATTKIARQQVTGIIVNKKTNVPIQYFRQTRSMLHSLEKFGHDDANNVYLNGKNKSDGKNITSHLHGRLSYIGHITDYGHKYTRLAKKFVTLTGLSLPLPLLDREKSTYVIITRPSEYQGTAIHIGNGYFLTASHTFDVPEGDDPEIGLSVFCPGYFPDALPGKLIQRDKETDAALIKVSSKEVLERPSINLVSRSISVGDEAHGFGYANYIDGSELHKVSATMSSSRKMFGFKRSEVDKPWPHGMSGGPVFDADGLFLGIIFSGPQHGTNVNPLGTAFTPYGLFSDLLKTWLEE